MKPALDKLQPIGDFLKKYGVMIIIIAVGCVYGYLVFTSSRLAQVEPDQAKVDEKYQGTKRPKLDQVVADKLAELEDNNVQFQALKDEVRRNPFLE